MMKNMNKGALDNHRYRVIVSTDIGGSDPDDFQSMVHYLLYSHLFDTEGLISSPWDKGRVSDIFKVIDKYEEDYEKLIEYSSLYPKPEVLRSITKQGAINIAPFKGYSKATSGSDWIIKCANSDDPRPLYILLWGLIEDLAQALHDDPSIKDKLRVYYIAGPNKKWGLHSYEYIRENFNDLWIIENNSTYRGWFHGGDQNEGYGNESFVSQHINGHGALGEFFTTQLGGVIKMGDTPSVTYLLKGNPEVPENPSWGGSFVKVEDRPKAIYERLTSFEDIVEVFSVVEFCFAGPNVDVNQDVSVFKLIVDNQLFDGYYCGDGIYKVRFMPKTTGAWFYKTSSKIVELDELVGCFTCVEESSIGRTNKLNRYPNWWSDIIDDSVAEACHKGAQTVNRWREMFLKDFEQRMDRIK